MGKFRVFSFGSAAAAPNDRPRAAVPDVSCVSPYLRERRPGVLDLDFAAVGDGGPDGDGLAGDVPAAVQSHPTRHRALRPTRQADFVLDLAVERLLQNVGKKEKRLAVSTAADLGMTGRTDMHLLRPRGRL